MKAHRVPRCTFPSTFISPTTLEVRSDPLSRPLGKLWELSGATVDDSLYLFFGLLRDRHHTIEILIDEKSHEHLPRNTKQMDIEMNETFTFVDANECSEN